MPRINQNALKMEFHPIANTFPLMEGLDFDHLKADIEANGLREPIWTYEGKILDGRNRYRACTELKIKPSFRAWKGRGSSLAFVISMNVKRRHLTGSQRATVAVELLPHLETEAKERQRRHGNTAPGRKAETLPEKLREVSGEACELAAQMLSTNSRYVAAAKKVKEVDPELFESVKAGTTHVLKALDLIDARESKGRTTRAVKSFRDVTITTQDEQELREQEDHIIASARKNNITPGLKPLIVPIAGLVFDPVNAREHNVRNLRANMISLAQYGQAKPIVVREADNVVVAGNGTLQACKELGWTEIAANIVPYTQAEAAGYGLADNRTAELAKWSFETVARHDEIIRNDKQLTVGFSADELEILRTVDDWTPPPIIEGETFRGKTEDDTIAKAIAVCKERHGKKLTDDKALRLICAEWLKTQ